MDIAKEATRAPLEIWVVIDTRGVVSTAVGEEHARAKAVCYDIDYPGLAPHRAARFVEQAP